MPNNIQEDRLRWVLMVEGDNLRLVDVVKVFPYSERTLKRWSTWAPNMEGCSNLFD